jgi:hypothetical protein
LLRGKKDRFIGRLDEISDLCAQGVEPPCETVVNGRDVVDADEQENGNGDCPNTFKAIMHGEDYTAMTILGNGIFS